MPLRWIALLCLSASLRAWNSQLLPWNAGAGEYQEATVNFASRSWRLLDYSYTGYKLGAQPLATGVPCTVFAVSGSGDITAALQAAINSAQASGGVVRIPAGSFTLSAPLYITGSNVSIEGAGSNATFIHVPATFEQGQMGTEGLFTFGRGAGGWNKGWVDQGTVLSDVTATVQEGQMFVDVVTPAAVNVGDTIVLRQYFWPSFSNSNSNSTWSSYTGWPSPSSAANRDFSFTYLRRVLAKSGNRLSLDAPTPTKLDPANNPIKIQLVPATGGNAMKQNVGLSGLSIRFADNWNDTSFTPARPAGAAVYFEGVRDGWCYDVVVRNLPRFAFSCDSAARITFLDCAVYDCQDDGGAGYGYAFTLGRSQQVLTKRCYAERVRHAYLCQHPLSNFDVFTQNMDHEARRGNDAHHSMVHGLLFDDHQSFEGAGCRMVDRGTLSINAYECVLNGVFWNFQGLSMRGVGADGGSISMNPSKDGWGVVVGGPGGTYKVFDGTPPSADLINPAAGLQVGPTLQAPGPGSKDRNALYEGIGQSGLTPASLYEAQLLRRLGSAPADFAPSCAASFDRAPVVPTLYPGPGTLVFDADHVGWDPELGGPCDPAGNAQGGTITQQCWADSGVRNHTAGGSESVWLTLTGTDNDILMAFIGTLQARNAFSSLSFWAYSSVAGLQLRVSVAQRQDGNYTDVNAASTVVSVPTANAWTLVSIPMSSFGTGTTLFNKVQIRSYSTNAGATVYLDDILLNGGATPTPSPTATRTSTPTPTRTPSPFFSQTATLTASPSASPSATRSATASPSASATISATRSASPSPSPTATATASLSASPTLTRSASATLTPSSSPTATPTASSSASQTASPSATPSRTRSASPTLSASPSLTPSATPPDTPSASPSFTEVPPGATATATPSASPTPSGTPSATRSGTLSPSPSQSPTLSGTPSPTQSPTVAASASASATGTASPTASPTRSVTGSATQTPSQTPSLSASATGTASPTGSATRSVTVSATQTPSLSPSPAASPSPSPSVTPTPGLAGTLTPTLTATLSPSASRTPATSATPRPLSSGGKLAVLKGVAFPQPDPQELRVLLDGPCDDLVVKLYSPAWVLQDVIHSGPLPAGWNRLKLPDGLPRGICYASLRAQLGARQSPAVPPLRLVRLR